MTNSVIEVFCDTLRIIVVHVENAFLKEWCCKRGSFWLGNVDANMYLYKLNKHLKSFVKTYRVTSSIAQIIETLQKIE
ncbi:hypothetical protein H5410_035113 [Solanum commersonii]|uniref:Uncharacterized protein n=1 Tax=Solanum commersonii TaxID=4109 RepID=A0A9J5Y0B5_SOLCO|nr:hypothetical protein H5410_035113 [Solanum commersonii]